MNIWQKIIGIYYRPEEVFEQLKPKTSWWVPLIIVLAVSAAAVMISRPIVMPEILAEIAKNPDIPAENMAQIQQRIENPIFSLINVVIGLPLAWLAVGLVFWGVFSMLGGKSTFVKMFAATVWAWMVSIPGSLVKVPLMFVMETAKVHTSLALILPLEMEETFLFRLLSQVDIFAVWTLSVMAIGYSAFTGIKQKKSLWAVFITWAVWIVVLSFVKGMTKMAG
ncbi:YIP1 family protein [candidate division TA06 bacterium]|nr:YIP1 family protein [candidate division TA06 bacterium]